jgi:site-specific recombinase XerD
MPRKLLPPIAVSLPMEALESAFFTYLAAGRRSEATVKQYAWALARLHSYLDSRNLPRDTAVITPTILQEFQTSVSDTQAAATAAAIHRAMSAFFAWAAKEGEIQTNPMARVPAPLLPSKPVAMPAADDVRALIKACVGPTYEDIRDTAMVRLLIDTGMRRAELGNLRVDDVRLEANVAIVTGKGEKTRACPFYPKTAQALRRYIFQARPRHPDRTSAKLWLGANGAMTPDGVRWVLDFRADKAHIRHINPHAFRNLAAHRYLSHGGNQNNLMVLMGWTSPQMVAHYVQSTAVELAIGEYQRLGLDDDLD